MITVAPAFDHVASSTIDGIAHVGSWIHGHGPRPNQPRIVLNVPVGLASKNLCHSRIDATGGITTGR